mmetsp:Transcript_16117/g.24307  ORF Transcript_16117/g.24307 Transcript_16117/m.24307 type:complete len:207 (+) Transcript_16117:902-1522(+)
MHSPGSRPTIRNLKRSSLRSAKKSLKTARNANGRFEHPKQLISCRSHLMLIDRNIMGHVQPEILSLLNGKLRSVHCRKKKLMLTTCELSIRRNQRLSSCPSLQMMKRRNLNTKTNLIYNCRRHYRELGRLEQRNELEQKIKKIKQLNSLKLLLLYRKMNQSLRLRMGKKVMESFYLRLLSSVGVLKMSLSRRKRVRWTLLTRKQCT